MLDQVTPALAAAVTGYGVVAGASSLLQARRMRRRGTASDVSLAFLGLYVAGYGLWLLYGLAIGSLPLIVVDAVGLLCGAFTIGTAARLRRRAMGRPVAGHPSPPVSAVVRPIANLSGSRRRTPASRGRAPCGAGGPGAPTGPRDRRPRARPRSG